MRCQVIAAAAALCAGLGSAGSSRAAVVSINFVGGAGAEGTLAATDQAGSGADDAFLPNWNNATGATGQINDLVLNNGTRAGVGVAWNAPGTWQLPSVTNGLNLAGGANPAMMKGYLDFPGTGEGAQTTVTITGLPPTGAYSVLVYFDGDNGNAWRVANMTIGAVTKSGEDSEEENFNSGTGNNPDGLFQLPAAGGTGDQTWPASPNNGEGNYLRFDGVTGSTFTLTAVGGPNSGSFRAPVNGLQVINFTPVPEPGSAAVMAVLGCGLLARRRRART